MYRLPVSDEVTTVLGLNPVGAGDRGGGDGSVLKTPYSLCADPLRPDCYYVGDLYAITHCDMTTDSTRLVAGGDQTGYKAGFGAGAQFNYVMGLAAVTNSTGTGTGTTTKTTTTLYVSDYGNNQIREVNTQTQGVTSVAGDRTYRTKDGIGLDCSVFYPRRLVFDRSRTATATTTKPESILYIASEKAIRRLDLTTFEMTTCKSSDQRDGGMLSVISPWGIDITPSGHLIVSGSHAVFLYDPRTGEDELLAGSRAVGDAGRGYADGASSIGTGSGTSTVRFRYPLSLVVVDHDRCAFVTDLDNARLRCLALPASLFSE